MEPVRTCVGCRNRAEKSSLVRVIARDSALDIDSTASAGGRGAWVHPSPECVAQAITRKAFGRALKTTVTHTEALDALLNK
jgi:predicted RNA-binding protein YlxR (DUF448 family)